MKRNNLEVILVCFIIGIILFAKSEQVILASEMGVSGNSIISLQEVNQESNSIVEMESVPVFLQNTIALWGYHKAVIDKSGNLYLWGYNNFGQLGNGTRTNSSENLIKVLENVRSVSLGYDFSAAITENGDLYLWGAGYEGQLGNGRNEIDNYSLVPIKILNNVLSVSLGGGHTAAVTKDGNLYVWGWNIYGQLGNGTYNSILNPTKLLNNVAMVECGSDYSAAITKDGNLYMWGRNQCGQLGNGTWDDQVYPTKIMDNVFAVSCGGAHTAIITKDGNLYMCGDNSSGELGINRSTQFQNTPIKVMENVVKVSCGGNHTAALTSNGDLYIWGDNERGQLGNGKNGSGNYSDIPIKVMSNVADIVMGQGNSAAITQNGSMYIWGDIYSTLEEESVSCYNVPTKLMDNVKLPEIVDGNEIFDGQSTLQDKTGTEGFVYRLYNVAMGREADDWGFNDWNTQLKNKEKTAAEVARGFIFSEEFKNFNYNNVQYVKILYRTMFGREADEGGLNGWVSDLENGMSREYVYRGFAESAEFTNLCGNYGVERGSVTLSAYRDQNAGATGFIARLYTKMLGRGYDEDGLEYWCRLYLTGERTIENVASDGFLHSEELKNQNLSDEEFVRRMYQTFLNREPDEAGLKDWLGRLSRGEETRDSLVYGFTNSREFGELKKKYNLP